MSLILALDTAADACSVALHDTRDPESLRELHELAPRCQAVRLLPMVHALLDDCGTRPDQLAAIAFGQGPGSFTGLRIAAAAAQGLAWGLSLPVLPVSSLAALALQARRLHDSRCILALQDARMDQVYWGAYRAVGSLVEPVMPEQVNSPESVRGCLEKGELTRSWVGGAGAEGPLVATGAGCCYSARLDLDCILTLPHAHPRASDIARLATPCWESGEGLDASQAVPVYVRDTVASRPRSRAVPACH